MSEPKLISPLLDGFVMGAPVSSHQGVRCYPAMKKNSDNKYIVKVVSVPASPKQLEALVLTGACENTDAALAYFKEQADGICAEAQTLRMLSEGDGFLPFEGWQTVPVEGNLPGYQIYLLGSYKRSLDKLIRRELVSGRDAVKLGRELCAALSACRKAGFLYAALKPTNIYLSEQNTYCIGDVGFLKLDTLAYTPLPGKYQSVYTPPETQDAMHTLDGTVDTYSLGLILYQVCSHGMLPPSEGPFAAPPEASEALVEIIRKAISPEPSQRWQNPGEMAKALSACEEETPTYTPASSEESGSNTLVFSSVEKEAILSAASQAVSLSDTRAIPTAGQSRAVPSVSFETRRIPDVPGTPMQPDASADSEPSLEEFLSDLNLDDYGDPSSEDEEDEEDDVVRVLSGHSDESRRRHTSKGKGWIIPIVLILVFALLGAGGYYYYENYYLQRINSLRVEGMYSQLTVLVDTSVEEGLLDVTCTDTYGNTQRQKLSNGRAEFTNLLPNSQYRIHLEIEGFHKLIGKTSDVFNTESKTEIVSFSGITGSEDGSVMLTFTVDGPEPEEWIVTYTAEGEEEKSQRFTGHAVTVKDLTVSKLYTFLLSPSEEMYVTGQTSLEFTASRLIMAQNLTISSFDGEEMTARWDTPANTTVNRWTVRCFCEGGYEQVLETTENKAVFSGIDPARSCYVEVTAEGMTQPVRTSVTANPITVTSLKVDEDDTDKLTVNWSFRGETPEGGWLLMYSLDGSNTKSVVKVKSDSSAEISPRIPGTQYRFEIQAADSTSIFNNIQTYDCPEAEPYTDHSFEPDKVTARLLRTPEKNNWTKADIREEDYTTQFSVGDNISVLLSCSARFFIPEDPISIMFVIRNADGDVDAKLISETEDDWHDLWVHYDTQSGELDIPTVPTQPGDYTVSIYFNGKFVATTAFSIVQ